MLQCLGFLVNTEKSALTPSQSLNKKLETIIQSCSSADHARAHQDNREDVSCSINYPHCSPLLSGLAEFEECSIQVLRVLRHSGCPGPTCNPGPGLVGSRGEKVEWQTHQGRASTHSDRLRCIPPGMGSLDQSDGDEGALNLSRKALPYQHPGDDGRDICCQSICEGLGEQFPLMSQDRQHHSSGLRQSPGGHSVPTVGQEGERAVIVVPQQGDHTFSRVPTRGRECYSQSSVKDSGDFSRVDAEPSGFPGSSASSGSLQSGSVRNLLECSAGQVHVMEA